MSIRPAPLMPGEAPAPEFPTLGRDTLVTRVAGLLTDAIMAGRLQPGARLSESAIAREMGLSRAPVREAARLLESSGLVVSSPGRGFSVRTVTADALDTLYELRLAIETAAVGRLVRHGAQAAVPALRTAVQALHDVARDGDPVTRIQADMAFHRLICAASGNERFLSVFDQIANETRVSVTLIGQIYADPRVMAATHEPILGAIAAGDAAAAEAAVAHHIGDARTKVVALFRKIEGQKIEDQAG